MHLGWLRRFRLVNQILVHYLHVLEYAKISILRSNDVIKQTRVSKFERTTLIIIIIDIMNYHNKLDDYFGLKHLITTFEFAYVYINGQIRG